MVRKSNRSHGGHVRIIGGRWRGRRIPFLPTEGLRPTPDRVRETVFNWLAPIIEGARVLDLFAGSGILGFEALSRGAGSVTAVDNHDSVIKRLRQTAGMLEAENYEARLQDARSFVESSIACPFDLIFVDPPHAQAGYEALCRALDASGVVRPGALVYLEFDARRAAAFTAPGSWRCHRDAKAGHLAYQLWRPPG